MKQILYIGNHLSQSGGNPSVAERLAPLLQPAYALRLVSGHPQKGWRMWEMLVAVQRYGRAEQPVVIDVYSTLNFYYAWLVALYCRWRGLRYVCVLHGGNLPARLRQSPRLCRSLFGGAADLAAPSGYLQQAFQSVGYAVRLIPNFLELSNYPFRERRVAAPRLLWVRAFHSTYNPALAIEIVAALKPLYPDVQLCMVGPEKDGSMARCRQLVADRGLAAQVEFTGRLSKAEWIARSAEFDFFINTTHFDNVPVSVLEAMALGLPVISSNVGGLPFLINSEEDGILVPEGDAHAFVAAISACIQNPDKVAHLSKQARQKAEQFDWVHIKPLWMELLS